MSALEESDLTLQRFYRWEREKAGRPFLTQPYDGGQVRNWTFAEAGGEIRRMAAYLKRNYEPGTRVAILAKNCAWWVMSDLAIWMAGHVGVPVYPSLKAESVRQILEHSDAKVCFIGATDEKEPAMEGIPPGVERIFYPTAQPGGQPTWDSIVAAETPISGDPTRDPAELATIIYTSGTTGIPKGVMHSFGGLGFQARALEARIVQVPNPRAFSYLPLAHIVERCGLENLTFRQGWHVFFAERLETFVADLQRARPHLFLSVPRLMLKFQQGVFEKVPPHKLERLLRIPLLNVIVRRKILRQLGLLSVVQAACGAAPLGRELLKWYRGLGLNLMEGFGLTETMITHLPKPGTVRPGYVGQALDGVEAKRSENGELLLRSPMNMLGYYKDPANTQAAYTPDGFFRTGDVVEIDADGQLKIIGRIKEQFKTSKGKYVAPAPIEAKLMAHPDVESACIMGAGLPNPFALVVLSAEARARCASGPARQEMEDLFRTRLEQINGQLDPHERLMFIAIVDGPWTIGNGMLTPTLKIRRNSLESQYLALIEDWRSQGRPVVWEQPAAGQAQVGRATS